MNTLLQTLGNPIWQMFTVVLALAAPLLIIAVRTRDVHASEQRKRRDTMMVLLVCLAAFLLMSGLVSLSHLQDASPTRISSNASAPAPTHLWFSRGGTLSQELSYLWITPDAGSGRVLTVEHQVGFRIIGFNGHTGDFMSQQVEHKAGGASSTGKVTSLFISPTMPYRKGGKFGAST